MPLSRQVDQGTDRFPKEASVKWFVLGLFALTVLGGTFLALEHRKQKKVPLVSGVIHGSFGLLSLVTLGAWSMSSGISIGEGIAVGLLLVAALGGSYLFSVKRKTGQIPMGPTAIHVVLALLGLGSSLAAILAG